MRRCVQIFGLYCIYIYLECYAPLLVKWDPRYVMDVLLASCNCSLQETVEIWVKLATWELKYGSRGYFNFLVCSFFIIVMESQT